MFLLLHRFSAAFSFTRYKISWLYFSFRGAKWNTFEIIREIMLRRRLCVYGFFFFFFSILYFPSFLFLCTWVPLCVYATTAMTCTWSFTVSFYRVVVASCADVPLFNESIRLMHTRYTQTHTRLCVRFGLGCILCCIIESK